MGRRAHRRCRPPRSRPSVTPLGRFAPSAEEYAGVPWWLAEDYPELFEFPSQFKRLTLYSIAYDVRDLLMFPPAAPAQQLNELHSLNRLRSTVAGRSHLDLLDAARGPG